MRTGVSLRAPERRSSTGACRFPESAVVTPTGCVSSCCCTCSFSPTPIRPSQGPAAAVDCPDRRQDEGRTSVLFHIEQVHSPENCPYGKGGSRSLHDASVEGVEVKGFFGAFMEHT